MNFLVLFRGGEPLLCFEKSEHSRKHELKDANRADDLYPLELNCDHRSG